MTSNANKPCNGNVFPLLSQGGCRLLTAPVKVLLYLGKNGGCTEVEKNFGRYLSAVIFYFGKLR